MNVREKLKKKLGTVHISFQSEIKFKMKKLKLNKFTKILTTKIHRTY